jgi:hypothetical protein
MLDRLGQGNELEIAGTTNVTNATLALSTLPAVNFGSE